MDAASRTGVDDVREIIEATRFRPMQARTKVFVIDEVHMLTRNAFNALLKTLEEPPAHVKFVFATTEIRKVPVTVLSRCQRFDLRRVRTAELTGLFARIAEQEQVPVAPGALDLIARAADGSVRDGLSLLDQAMAQWEPESGPIDDNTVINMLGLADRGMVFDMLDAVMAGIPREALQITERAYARGADLGILLQDLLELIHTVTRMKAIPSLRDSAELPEAERTRGAALADALSVPVLGRAWQMLLKGVAEVEAAPDRRAAAEMVLIRLCHVSDLPTPGELVRRLSEAPAPPPGGGGGMRAVAGGSPAAAQAIAVPASAPLSPPLNAPPASFRAMAAMVAEQREAMLHAHLLHSVHLVRYAPPVIELRPEPAAPRDLAARLSGFLAQATGMRWTIALSAAPGEPTLAEQGTTADAARRSSAAEHPLVRAILEAFPGARIEGVHDPAADAYGLVPEPPPDLPEFAPPEADLAYDTDDDPMELDA